MRPWLAVRAATSLGLAWRLATRWQFIGRGNGYSTITRNPSLCPVMHYLSLVDPTLSPVMQRLS